MKSYQVADNNLAFARNDGGLGGRALGGSTTGGFGVFLNTTDGGSSGSASRTLRATAAGRAALGRDDLVKRSIELSRHFDGWIDC